MKYGSITAKYGAMSLLSMGPCRHWEVSLYQALFSDAVISVLEILMSCLIDTDIIEVNSGSGCFLRAIFSDCHQVKFFSPIFTK